MTTTGSKEQTLDWTAELKTERHALHMLLNRSVITIVMHFVVAVLLAIYLSASLPPWRGVFFVTGLTIGLILQLKLARTYGASNLDEQVFNHIRQRFDLLAIWVGCMWGFAGFFLFVPDDPTRQVFLTFVMGGMSLSAVGTQGMRLRTCYSSIVPGMAPLGLSYLSLGSLTGYLSGGLIFAYLIVLVTLAKKINEFMLQAFRLQVEKDDLLGELHAQADELREARETADEANESKSRFLAQASHDLRQPLHAISLFVESFPDAETEKERAAILDRARQSLNVLTKLFDSLLDVTMLDTGGVEVRESTFRMTEIIDEVLSDFELIAKGYQVELRRVPTTLAVKSDPVLVRRMLQNLVSNAIRYSEGGRVLVGCRRNGDKVSLHVIDTGQGISDADQARVFREITRLDVDRMGKTAKPGLGLGLSIVKRLAQELGLQIQLRSKAGRGSDFAITGLKRGEPAAIVKPVIPVAAGVVEGARVFVLDDDPETLAATEMLLKRWGCSVSASQNPDDLFSAEADLIICDYELAPGRTGLDVLDELNAKSTNRAPAIMISGHTASELRVATAERNIPLIHKPLRPAQLKSALLNALSGSDNSARAGKRRSVVCSPKSGPLFELVPASDMELNYGQETEA